MILVWRGWGLLVLGFALGAFMLCTLVFDVLLGPAYFKLHHWPTALALALAAAASWLIGRHMNAGDPDSSGYLARPPNVHTLFFIPMQHWGFILGAFSLFTLAKEWG